MPSDEAKLKAFCEQTPAMAGHVGAPGVLNELRQLRQAVKAQQAVLAAHEAGRPPAGGELSELARHRYLIGETLRKAVGA